MNPIKANTIILVWLLIAVTACSLKNLAQEESESLWQSSQQKDSPLVGEQDLRHLPSLLQRYLRYTGIIGKPTIRFISMQQTGQFKASPEGQWQALEARQSFAADPLAFIWYGRIPMFAGLAVAARDKYQAGHGEMLIRLGPLTIAEQNQAEVAQSALARLFMEFVWMPTAFLRQDIVWQQKQDRMLRGTLTDQGIKVSVDFTFNEKNQIIYSEAKRYFSDGKSKVRLETFFGEIKDYAFFDGMMMPSQMEGGWRFASGEYRFVRLKVVKVRVNQPPF